MMAIAGCGAAGPNSTATAASVASGIETEKPGDQVLTSFRVIRSNRNRPAPNVAFIGPQAASVSLAQFTGRPFLVSLWSSAFPASTVNLRSLDQFASEGKIAVIAISVGPPETVDAMDVVDKIRSLQGLKVLADYRDPSFAIFNALGPAIPTSILYDVRGREVLRILGTVDFCSPEIRALVAEVL